MVKRNKGLDFGIDLDHADYLIGNPAITQHIMSGF